MDNTFNAQSVSDVNKSFEKRDAQERAEKLGLDFIELEKFPINPDVLLHLESEKAASGKVAPFFQSGTILKVAAIHPESQATKNVFIELKNKGFDVQVFVCTGYGLAEIMKHYQDEFFAKEKVEVVVENDEDALKNKAQQEVFAELKTKIQGAATETALSEVKITALALGASDIHYQPTKTGFILRFRIDGILYDVLNLDGEAAVLLRNRVKYESGMRANVVDVPQDGHSKFMANGREVDLRVSTLPTPQGESVVVRILDSMKGVKNFEELGFSKVVADVIERSTYKKSGMIIVSGPTGSGKTTTLYSILKDLNSSEKKIVTLEDPVEYQLEGISQSQVNENTNYNFETGLKALLRHDPDIILVGEIRSKETAKLAIEASLTGHLVLTSLHTNSALGVLTRLRNLGIKDFNLGPSLQCCFAQRLVRRVCPHCAKNVEIPKDKKFAAAMKKVGSVMDLSSLNGKIKAPVGCEECSFLGYKGRLSVGESVEIDETVKEMVVRGDGEPEIKKYLYEQTPFLSLYESGVYKVLLGVTTYEEISRVLD